MDAQTMQMKQPDEILTPEQVAAVLKVSLETVMRHLRAGEIAGFKVGKLWRIRRSAIESLMTKES